MSLPSVSEKPLPNIAKGAVTGVFLGIAIGEPAYVLGGFVGGAIVGLFLTRISENTDSETTEGENQ